VELLYGLLFFDATFLALARPSRAAMLPLIVPEAIFGNAVAWNSSLLQMGLVAGPALGGLVVAIYLPGAYIISAAGSTLFGILILRVKTPPRRNVREPMSLERLLGGARFVWRSRLVLAAISLDMFAVLLGGAVTLLPVYAKDILHAGPAGLGWMRAAPAIGAFCVAMLLAHRRPFRRSGHALLLSVAGFGAATIVFGFSQNFWISLLSLFLIGAFDNISVVIRHTLVQVLTPDELRGRVSAVNSLFIGASNELGGFESGLVARAFGPVVSVVSGGAGTILIVAAVAVRFPRLRRYGRLGTREEPAAS
jgi:MFS family permease